MILKQLIQRLAGLSIFAPGASPVYITADTTLTKDHLGKRLVLQGATGRTVTVPAGLNTGTVKNARIEFVQEGAGVITFAAADGVTLSSANTYVKTAGAGSVVTIVATSANKYALTGDGAVA